MPAVDVTKLGSAQSSEDWRLKLDVIWRSYQKDRNPEAKEQYRALLKRFSDYIVTGARVHQPMKTDQSCELGRQLRDAYLFALSREDSVRRACHLGEVTARELADARDDLRHSRNQYWAHVERHQCRED